MILIVGENIDKTLEWTSEIINITLIYYSFIDEELDPKVLQMTCIMKKIIFDVHIV